MSKRFVIALIKHETNTFSPIATPLSAFGHGNGPSYGEDARQAFAGSNTPFAAFLDIARREGAEAVTPVAAESWPSNAATRATFEALLEPLEAAVRAGCDACFLDLHGAMVVEGCDDAEGEILRRLRRIRPDLPIAVTFDYHTNLSPDIVANATVITGYKTYPHVDMYEAGLLAGDILARSLRGAVRPVMAWGWLPLVSSVMRHAPEDGPSGDILAYARAMEKSGRVLAATLLPGFAACRHALSPACPRWSLPMRWLGGAGGGAGSVRSHARHRLGAARRIRVPSGAAGAIGRAGARTRDASAQTGPILLIDHCDNCGSGGAQDVMLVVEEILRQNWTMSPSRPSATARRWRRWSRPASATTSTCCSAARPTCPRSASRAGRCGSPAACAISPTAKSYSPGRCIPA